MDNTPKENKDESNQSTGEIFSDTTAESAYQEATLAPQADSIPDSTIVENQQTLSPEATVENTDQGNNIPPPSFVEENKKKKFIVFGVGGLIVLLILFFIIKLLFNSKPKPPPLITLNYWGLWEDKEIIQPILDEYKKNHSNITINYIKQDPKLYRERLKVAIDKGEGPDIFRFHNTWVPMFKNYLSALPKTAYSDAEFEKTFFPVASSDLKAGGNFYGLPLMIDGLLLFYNEDILKGANVAVPVTWVDVQNALPKLTVKEKGKIVTAGIAMGTAENVEHFSDILGLMMLQNGTKLDKSLFSCVTSPPVHAIGDSTSSTNDSSSTTSTTCGTDTLTYYRKFAEAPNNSWDETLDNSIIAFAGGKVAMIFAPSWEVNTIKAIPGGERINLKTAKVPQLPCDKPPCATVNWASYWVEGVSGKGKNQKEAWEFLKFLSNQNTMKKLYELQVKSRNLFGEPYSRVDLAASLSDNPYLAPLMAEAPTMKSFYIASRTNDGETGLNSTLIVYLKNAVNSLSSGTSAETALKTADEGFKQVYTRFGLIAPVPTQ